MGKEEFALQLNMTTDYAIRMMLFLYIKRDQSAVSMEEIAHAMKIPVTYVPKITRMLKDAGMIETVIGVNGGCRILDMAGNITLYAVSYTHLDVYKRQSHGGAGKEWP